MFQAGEDNEKAPPMIAKGIAEAIEGEKMFQKVESVNAYVNMFMSKAEFADNVVKRSLKKMRTSEGVI